MHTEQKVWSNCSLKQQNYLNYPTFTFVGPLSVGAPVRPNMLNMPKSTSGELITFRVSRRQREMYIGHARLCVCVSV